MWRIAIKNVWHGYLLTARKVICITKIGHWQPRPKGVQIRSGVENESGNGFAVVLIFVRIAVSLESKRL